jgi:6,7-dimethyl-8-ribityllumazine synthase
MVLALRLLDEKCLAKNKLEKQMDANVLIIKSKWNSLITDALCKGALETLEASSIEKVDTVSVPGCFELPVTAVRAARSKRYDAIIALGCVIKGETPHFDFVAGETARGLMNVGTEYGLPVIFGVLTTDNEHQALARAGLKGGNKGCEAAATAIEMINTLKCFEEA